MQKFRCIFVSLIVCVVVMLWSASVMAEEIVIGYSGPLSGPAAEYAQDCLFGVDFAVKEINTAGGVNVQGKKYTFRLEKLDDRSDPTAAVNNARRFRNNKAIAVYNGMFTTLAAIAKINEEKGNEFLLMAYTSTPRIVQLGNHLLIVLHAPEFTVYVQQFSELAMQEGWRKVAMVGTLGAYGDEWRKAFSEHWKKSGGTITIDKPANYYTDTDFSAPLTAALATKPDALLIGGPSATTALVIEQARGMGFTGGFILIDQAKMDYIATVLNSYKLMGNTIGVSATESLAVPVTKEFSKRYKAAYNRIITSECLKHYGSVVALAKAIEKAGTTSDVRAIRAALPKVLPLVGDKVPTEIFGIEDNGRLFINGSAQLVKNGKLLAPSQYCWWVKNNKELEAVKKLSKTKTNIFRFVAK